MGIKGLTQLIKQNAPEAIETMNLHKLSGKKVAVDTSLFMYKMLIWKIMALITVTIFLNSVRNSTFK